ncbi:fluoride efflux transporter FluC [Metabacillus lacus]|nr:CrcB family protein [Metabacillus lacus]
MLLADLLFVGIGGFSGAILRYTLSKYLGKYTAFPFGTAFVNLTGAFAVGILAGYAGLSDRTNLLFISGFLGSYTTYSTFMLELYSLLQKKRLILFLTYVSLTFAAGFFFTLSGYWIGQHGLSFLL